MENGLLDPVVLDRFVRKVAGRDGIEPEFRIRPLSGGIEAAAVARLDATWTTAANRRQHQRFTVKVLEGHARREAAIYRSIICGSRTGIAPRFVDVEAVPAGALVLFLEWIEPVQRWPWKDTGFAGSLLLRLAEFHENAPADHHGAIDGWDYEQILADAARTTLLHVESLDCASEFGRLRRFLPGLRRLVHALPRIRREILEGGPLRATLIHGDAHPGNAMVRKVGGRCEPVLIDWGRLRAGSPLEDVSSWLQSLRYWEPEVQRRHDTLLRLYLGFRGVDVALNRALRESYWLAGACNLLAGAIHYHVLVAEESPPRSRRRAAALEKAADALRVIRRADLLWSEASRSASRNPELAPCREHAVTAELPAIENEMRAMAGTPSPVIDTAAPARALAQDVGAAPEPVHSNEPLR